jgi:hypothetical protein
LSLLVLSCAWAQSQPAPATYNGNYYGFGSFGACQHGYGIFGGGGGAEGLLWKGVSVGVDGSYQQFTDGGGYGFLTGQGGYHFVNRKAPLRWDPFVTAGAGVVFGKSGGSGPTANLGGGAIYWVKPRLGIRFEFRIHAMSDEAISTGRIGLSFR